MSLKAPFPYFGGKSKVAYIVWQLLGRVKTYIEPCFGSGAVLLNRPDWNPGKKEIVNDYDCMISNFWRAIKWKPDETAYWADWPVNHADLCARRYYLQGEMESLREKVMDDPDFCNTKVAGWWVWCASVWIGSEMLKYKGARRPHITSKQGICQTIKMTGKQGVKCKRPNLNVYSTGSKGVTKPSAKNGIEKWFRELQARFQSVDVICGDWSRVCGGNWQTVNGVCGIFFDPPYGMKRKKNLYSHDSMKIAADIREWCRKKVDDPKMRIVLAGYYDEHKILLDEGWGAYRWKTNGGYANQVKGKTRGKKNSGEETLFYSPHCAPLIPEQPELFREE